MPTRTPWMAQFADPPSFAVISFVYRLFSIFLFPKEIEKKTKKNSACWSKISRGQPILSSLLAFWSLPPAFDFFFGSHCPYITREILIGASD